MTSMFGVTKAAREAGIATQVTANSNCDEASMRLYEYLNAGIIDQAEAKKRRTEVGQEADFYGSMDGASKFVRGDAVAHLDDDGICSLSADRGAAGLRRGGGEGRTQARGAKRKREHTFHGRSTSFPVRIG